MDAFFEDISANNVPTPPTQTTGPQLAQTTSPNNEFEELLSRSTQKLYLGCNMTTLEFTSEISHIKMACVTPRSHGGDAGGSPPRRPTRPSAKVRNCLMLRIETENRSLRKAFRENNEQPLKIGFDYEDLGTFHPLANFSGILNSLMGETVRPLPLAISTSRNGTITRTKIKADHYAKHTSPDEAKNHPPPSRVWGDRTEDDWNQLVDWKLPGGASTSRRRANRAFGDVMTRDQITQMFRQQEQEKELLRKQAEEAQARAYLAVLKADAAA
ncbi:hypothetical protein Tco_0787494 [Tanacetum coccineum]